MKYYVTSGSLQGIIDADTPRDAAKLIFGRARVSPDLSPQMWLATETFVSEHGFIDHDRSNFVADEDVEMYTVSVVNELEGERRDDGPGLL